MPLHELLVIAVEMFEVELIGDMFTENVLS